MEEEVHQPTRQVSGSENRCRQTTTFNESPEKHFHNFIDRSGCVYDCLCDGAYHASQALVEAEEEVAYSSDCDLNKAPSNIGIYISLNTIHFFFIYHPAHTVSFVVF